MHWKRTVNVYNWFYSFFGYCSAWYTMHCMCNALIYLTTVLLSDECPHLQIIIIYWGFWHIRTERTKKNGRRHTKGMNSINKSGIPQVRMRKNYRLLFVWVCDVYWNNKMIIYFVNRWNLQPFLRSTLDEEYAIKVIIFQCCSHSVLRLYANLWLSKINKKKNRNIKITA